MTQIRSSESIANLAAALAAAQAEFKPAVKNCVNPHFKNRYADLSAIIDATREALSKHGLSYVQCPIALEGRVITVTRLMHKSGEWLECDLSLKPAQDSAQQYGSVITYGRRYSLSSILGISDADDDDGNVAQGGDSQLQKDMEKLQKDLQQSRNAAVDAGMQMKALKTNVGMLRRFESEYNISHAQLMQLCGLRDVGSWTEEDREKLRAAGSALKNGAEWDAIELSL